MRESGEPPMTPDGMKIALFKTPVCFVEAINLSAEAAGAEDTATFLKVIARERECPRFTPWQQGYSAKEHKAMVDAEELRMWQLQVQREEREYRDRQRKEDIEDRERRIKEEREYRDRRDRDDQEWRLRQERENRRQSSRQLWIAGVLTALAVAIILAAAQIACTWWQIGDARAARSSPPSVPTAPAPLAKP